MELSDIAHVAQGFAAVSQGAALLEKSFSKLAKDARKMSSTAGQAKTLINKALKSTPPVAVSHLAEARKSSTRLHQLLSTLAGELTQAESTINSIKTSIEHLS